MEHAGHRQKLPVELVGLSDSRASRYWMRPATGIRPKWTLPGVMWAVVFPSRHRTIAKLDTTQIPVMACRTSMG